MGKTLSTLRSGVRKELRDPDGIRFEDGDLDHSLNQAYRRLYLRILKANQDYFETSELKNIVNGTAEIALPADHYRTVRLEYVNDDGSTVPILYRDRGVTANYSYNSVSTLVSGRYLYSFKSQNIILEPTPSENKTNGIKHTYIATLLEADDLVAGSDEIHDDIKDIWADIIILDASVACSSQLESLGADMGNNLLERLREARETLDTTLSLRSLSPNKNRRRKGYFR